MYTCAFLLFLDASMHLYKRVCLSVRPSVHHAFSKNPRKRLFSVADDIRINGRMRARMKSIRLRNPDDERLQNTHTHTHTHKHTHTQAHTYTHTHAVHTHKRAAEITEKRQPDAYDEQQENRDKYTYTKVPPKLPR